jgi:glycosyltransferase involved in cell wall biosynthesis
VPFAVAKGLGVIRRHGIRALYSTSPPATTHLIAASLRRLARIPWIADFRDPWIEEGQHPKPGSLRARIEHPLERWVMRTADRVVVTTPRLREELLRRHPAVDPARVAVVYNGYDEEDFAAAPAPEPNPRFEILHAGFVTPEFRDPFPLLRALRGLIEEGLVPREDARVTLLGGGPYLDSEGFRTGLARLRLDGVVNVAGRVAHEEALALQGRAAVLLLLQASDDTRSLIPAKAFEYLRLGRPILALTLEGDTADLLRGMEHCHVVDPADDGALRNALLGLYRLWSDGAGGATVRRAVERFERRRLTGRLAGVLDEVA